MAYTAPTPSDLKAAFLPFATVDDGVVQFWLDRASRRVDASWTDGDRSFATMLLAAHLMVEQGLGTGAEAEAAASGASGFKTMRSGSLTLERFDTASAGGFGATSYGRQFLPLLRANRGGPLITATGALPCGYPGRW